MPIRRLSLHVAIGAALLAGCDQTPQTAAPPAEKPAPMVNAPAAAARADFQMPPPGFRGDPIRGRQLFTANCAKCHGEEALGTDQGPPLIHRIYEPSHHSDLAFYMAVARGVQAHHWNFGNMAPVPGLGGEDTAHIIAWVRAKQQAAGIH